MSWWETGEGEDVIGDRPADLLAGAFRELGAARQRETGERPSFRGLLAALSRVLSAFAGRPSVVVAVTSAGEVRGDDPAAQVEGAQFAPALDKAVGQLADEYRERWGRPPRPSEIAAAAAFVTRANPARYVRESDVRDLTLDTLRVEERAA